MAPIQLTDADNGKKMVVAVGDIITISLVENPTTGFLWTIDSLNQEIIVLRQAEFFLDKSGNTGVGGGGLRKFNFEIKGIGKTVLSLKLWREWEGENSVTKRYTISLEII